MDEIRPSFFYLCKLSAVVDFPHRKNFKHYDYEESCGFYNSSNGD